MCIIRLLTIITSQQTSKILLLSSKTNFCFKSSLYISCTVPSLHGSFYSLSASPSFTNLWLPTVTYLYSIPYYLFFSSSVSLLSLSPLSVFTSCFASFVIFYFLIITYDSSILISLIYVVPLFFSVSVLITVSFRKFSLSEFYYIVLSPNSYFIPYFLSKNISYLHFPLWLLLH